MSSQEVMKYQSDSSQTEMGEEETPVIMELRKELNAHTLMAYIAVSDRNAMAEQLKGLQHLNNAVVESQEMLQREKERSTNLQVALWRNEAFITRNKLQMKLMEDRLKECNGELEEWKAKCKTLQSPGNAKERKVIRDVSDDIPNPHFAEKIPESTTSGYIKQVDVHDVQYSKPASKDTEDEHAKDKPQPQSKPRLHESGILLGVSRELHEIVVQENIHLKNTLQQLLEKGGASLKDLTATIEYKEIIKQLKRKIKDLEDEVRRMEDAINIAGQPQEKTAKAFLDMEEKLNEVQKADKLKQILIEALSTRCGELQKDLEQSKPHEQLRISLVKSSFLEQHRSEAFSNPPQSGKLKEILPSIEIQNLIKENTKLKKLHQHQAVENETFRQERDMAKRETNDLHKKLDSLSHIANLNLQADLQCLQCREYKANLETTKRELSNTKEAHEVAVAMSKSYESDFNELSQKMEHVKKNNRSEIEVWKKNCHSLSTQTEQFKQELEKQSMVIGQLRAQVNFYEQELQKLKAISRLPSSADSSTSRSYLQLRCGPPVNPWQESTDYASMPSEVAVGGHDQCDLTSPQRDSNVAGFQKWSTARPGGSSRPVRKLECMRCHRTFAQTQQWEFEEHQRRCMDNS